MRDMMAPYTRRPPGPWNLQPVLERCPRGEVSRAAVAAVQNTGRVSRVTRGVSAGICSVWVGMSVLALSHVGGPVALWVLASKMGFGVGALAGAFYPMEFPRPLPNEPMSLRLHAFSDLGIVRSPAASENLVQQLMDLRWVSRGHQRYIIANPADFNLTCLHLDDKPLDDLQRRDIAAVLIWTRDAQVAMRRTSVERRNTLAHRTTQLNAEEKIELDNLESCLNRVYEMDRYLAAQGVFINIVNPGTSARTIVEA